ncbi:STAS domain-containing protein [Actinoplanes sp. NBC_00393]|uniref:STAS domain-containing protein n=1 Tax=Actinoplanes sp. NBC_00393 TaxID=2975953 RepID=UPI002E1CC59C
MRSPPRGAANLVLTKRKDDEHDATAGSLPATAGLATVRIGEHDRAAVVAVRGQIDAGSAPLLRDALGWAIAGHERVVVDLSGADHIDRAGLSVIIAEQARATTRGVQLCFTAPSPQLLTALCALRTGEVLSSADLSAPRVRSRPG